MEFFSSIFFFISQLHNNIRLKIKEINILKELLLNKVETFLIQVSEPRKVRALSKTHIFFVSKNYINKCNFFWKNSWESWIWAPFWFPALCTGLLRDELLESHLIYSRPPCVPKTLTNVVPCHYNVKIKIIIVYLT